jgi:hypothetical protein
MQLPRPPAQYGEGDQAQLRGTLEREDKRNVKIGAVFDFILLRDTATGAVKRLAITNGVIVIA